MPTRKVQPEKPRNTRLTATEAKYERFRVDLGLTTEQIASLTGRSVPTVRNALFRVREKNRDLENQQRLSRGSS